MPRWSIASLRERARGRSGRRAALSAGAALALAGAGWTVIQTAALGPEPAPVVVKSQAALVRTRAGRWVVKDLWSAPGPVVNVSYGYRRGGEAGPPLLRGWVREEALWIRAWPAPGASGPAAGEEPTEGDLRLVLSALAPEVLADPRVGKTRLSQGVHEVRTANWRGVSAWWAGALLWAGLPLAGAAGAAEVAANRRSPLVANGVCPRCRYALRGMDVARCPECGEALSTYEQTIVAALIAEPAPAPTRA